MVQVRETPNLSLTLVCPPLAEERVIRRPSTSTDPTTIGASVVGLVVEAAPLQQVPPRRPHAEPSHVATLQHLRKSGFSRGSAVEMSGCVRTDFHFSVVPGQVDALLWLVSWKGRCSSHVPMIVDFLVHLRRDKGLSVSAVKGYRAALNSVFALKGMDLADSLPISMLIRSFSKSVRPEELHPPAWDVTLVLQSLTRALYKPLRTSDERFLAQKTPFLLVLSLAKRVGELNTLSHCISLQGLGQGFLHLRCRFCSKDAGSLLLGSSV